MNINLVTVTPTIAKQLLNGNDHNRRIRPALVKMLRAEIEQGRWTVTHQGIALDDDGRLIDGQHRLKAIVESDTPVKMYVAKGIPTDAAAVIDGGVTRTYGDRALFAGDAITTTHIAIARTMRYGPSDFGLRSYGEVKGLVDKYRPAIDFVMTNRINSTATAPALAVVARAWYGRDHARLIEFLKVVALGDATGPEDWAAVRLRNTLIDNKTIGRVGSRTRTEIYRKTQSALDHFLRRQSMTKLYGTPDELYPIPA